jgi:hypothetical protein
VNSPLMNFYQSKQRHSLNVVLCFSANLFIANFYS